MADIVNSLPISTTQVSFTNTADAIADLGGATTIMVKSSADVYLGFDQPTAASQSYKLLAANSLDTTIELKHGNVNKLYAKGVSGSGTLYVIYMI